MLRTFFQWRYSRRERRPQYTFHNREHDNFGPAFGHYLSQHSAHMQAWNPQQRRRRWKRAGKLFLGLLGLLLIGWLGTQIAYSLSLF